MMTPIESGNDSAAKRNDRVPQANDSTADEDLTTLLVSHDVQIDSSGASDDSVPQSKHEAGADGEMAEAEGATMNDPPSDAFSHSEAQIGDREIKTEAEKEDAVSIGAAMVFDQEATTVPVQRRLWNFIRQRDASLSELPSQKLPTSKAAPLEVEDGTHRETRVVEKPVLRRMVGCLAGCLLQRKADVADRDNAEEYTRLVESSDPNDAGAPATAIEPIKTETPSSNTAVIV